MQCEQIEHRDGEEVYNVSRMNTGTNNIAENPFLHEMSEQSIVKTCPHITTPVISDQASLTYTTSFS